MSRHISAAIVCFLLTTTVLPAAEKVNSKEGGFTATFPAKPKQDKVEHKTPKGKLKIHQFLYTRKDDTVFGVIYTDFPKGFLDDLDARKVLDNARDGGVKNVSGKLMRDKEVQLNGRPGRSFDILVEKTGVEISTRIYFDKSRLYQVIVSSEKKGETKSRQAKAFLDSFKLMKKS